MMKNAFYFTSKAIFVLKIFKFLFCLFGHVPIRRLDRKDKVNFKCYDVTVWLKNTYCNTHIVQYLKKQRQSDDEIWLVNKINMSNIFLEKSYTECDGETSPRPFSKKLKLSKSLTH